MTQLAFGILTTFLISSCLMVALLSNPVNSALALVLTFIMAASLWLAMGSEFLALIMVLVYVGAVMTLFLFVVMLLNTKAATKVKTNLSSYAIVILIISGILTSMIYFSTPIELSDSAASLSSDSVARIGMLLYTEYAYSFVLAGVVLLLAIIISIYLMQQKPHDRKYQQIAKQQQANKQNRLSLME